MDNVTLRRKIRKSTSESDLSINAFNNDNESSLLNSTMLSLQNVTQVDTIERDDLKQEFEKLYKTIQTAENEIEILNSDNCQLKKVIETQHRQIEMLKKLTTDSLSCGKISQGTIRQKIIKHGIHTSRVSPINSSVRILYDTPHTKSKGVSHQARKKISFSPNTINDENIKFRNINDENNEIVEQNSNKPREGIFLKYKDHCLTSRKKILIVADQQGKGVRDILQKLLGSEFSVICIWKNQAPISELVNTIKHETAGYNKDDNVIILGGINEKKPFDSLFYLRTCLESLVKTNVIVGEVPFNKHLNEITLNYHFKFICDQYDNCMFLNMNYNQYIPPRRYLSLTLARYLHRGILRIQYSNKMYQYVHKNITINKNKSTEDKNTQTDFNDILNSKYEYISNDINNSFDITDKTGHKLINNDNSMDNIDNIEKKYDNTNIANNVNNIDIDTTKNLEYVKKCNNNKNSSFFRL